jgi:hypothetical protein
MRIRLYDLLNSRLPPLIGKCVGDVAGIAQYVNSAQRRLLTCREVGDEGWYGTWAEMAFIVSRSEPIIVTPREVARLEAITVCDRPVNIQNQFYEYLEFGNGRMSARRRGRNCGITQAYMRNDAITWAPLVKPPKLISIYPVNPSDGQSGARVLVSGIDQYGNIIYSQDGGNIVAGIYVTLANPFVSLPIQVNAITGIQKDPTTGPVQFFQVDPVTAAQSLILTMQPGELVAGYRRYYLHNLPWSCSRGDVPNPCANPAPPPRPVIVTALAKLEPIPVAVDSDYLILHNLEAMIEECCSVYLSEINESGAKEAAQEKHVQAIRLLQGELVHRLGKDMPAVSFKPFGDASLERVKIGMT